jgi:hypothetical protein
MKGDTQMPMEPAPLVLTSWLQREPAIGAVAEEVAHFFVAVAQWRTPYATTTEPAYYYRETWDFHQQPALGQPLERDDLAAARRQIQSRTVGTVRLTIPSAWRVPYVLTPDLYEPLALDIKVIQPHPECHIFEVQMRMDYRSTWFESYPGQGEIIYSSYSFVQDYLAAGYALFIADTLSIGDEQAYLPNLELCQANRRRVAHGVGLFIQHLAPVATVLLPSLPVTYDLDTRTFSIQDPGGPVYYEYYRDNPRPYLFHIPPNHQFAPGWLENMVYFPFTLAGVEVQLAEEIFGFLRDAVVDGPSQGVYPTSGTGNDR